MEIHENIDERLPLNTMLLREIGVIQHQALFPLNKCKPIFQQTTSGKESTSSFAFIQR